MPHPTRTLGAPLALAMALMLAACADDDDDSAPEGAEASPSQSSTPSDESPVAQTLPNGVLALPATPAGEDPLPLDAGRYEIPLSSTMAFQIDLPQGTTANNGGMYLVTADGIIKVEAADDEYGVPKDPCQRQDIEPVGPSVQDLVTAIRDEPVYRVGTAEPDKIGGARGTHLEIRVPAGYDAAMCTDGQVGLPGNPGSSNNMDPGYVGDWWVLDVDGHRVVAQQLCEACDADQSARLTQLIKSITFTSTS